LHARQQTLAMLDTTTGEVVKTTLQHEGNNMRGVLLQTSSTGTLFDGEDVIALLLLHLACGPRCTFRQGESELTEAGATYKPRQPRVHATSPIKLRLSGAGQT
jgi:hypothetical protein